MYRPPGGKWRKRRCGGQPHHPRQICPLLPPEEFVKTWLYEWETVPVGRKPLNHFRVFQQVELVERPYTVTEHRAQLCENLRTARLLAAPSPREVRQAGLLGPRLTALVTYQKGACHMSVEMIRGFFGDVLHLPISHGNRLLGKIKMLFRTWHRRDETLTDRWERAATQTHGEALSVARRNPTSSEVENITKRFRNHGDAYFTFLDTPGVEPTNNGPERQIPFLTIDRKITQGKITQGMRGDTGRRWDDRIWTLLPTCAPADPFRLRVHPQFDRRPLPQPPLSPPSYLYLRDRLPVFKVF